MSAPTCDWKKDGKVCGEEAVMVSIGIRDKIPHKYLCKKHGLMTIALQMKSGLPCRVIPCDPFDIWDIMEESGYMV